MRVTCPACAASYEVPDARIGTGRRLRCARCRHDWFVAPPDAPPATPLSPTQEPAASEPGPPAVAPPAAPPSAAPPSATPQASAPQGAAPPSAAPRQADAAAAAPVPEAASGAPPGDAARPAAGAADANPADTTLPGLAADQPRRPDPETATMGERGATAQAGAPGRSRALLIAWAATLILLCGFAAAVVLYRGAIMDAWPPAERFYAAIGMPRR